MFMLAEEVRQHMAKMRIRNFHELVGRTDKLKFSPNPDNPKASLLSFDPILKNARELRSDVNIQGGTVKQDFKLEDKLVNISYCILHQNIMMV